MFSLQRVHQEFAEIQQMLSLLLILEGPSRSVSGELAKFVPLLLPAGEVHLVQPEGGAAQEHVLLELTVVPHCGLQSPAGDHVPGDPVLQHLHEARITVPLHYFGLPLGLLGGVGMEIDFHVGIWFLLR